MAEAFPVVDVLALPEALEELDVVDPPNPCAAFFRADDEVERDAAAVLARDAVAPDNLRAAAGLGDLERLRAFFADGGALREGAGRGRGFYRPIFQFPRWTPSDDRQELLDEALTWAARSGRLEAMAELVARWLLDHGADPSLRHDFGGAQHGKAATALHLAAQFGCLRCLRLLLERGADDAVEDALYGGTPLGWAEYGGQHEAAAILREHRELRGDPR